LEGRKGSKGNDQNPRIVPSKLVLALAQLCSMFAAGQSAKVAQENQQHMLTAVQNFGQLYGIPFLG
jgi:hypothetical protein